MTTSILNNDEFDLPGYPPEPMDLPRDLKKLVRDYAEARDVLRFADPPSAYGACETASRDFAEFAKGQGHEAKLVEVAWPYHGSDQAGRLHFVTIGDDYPIDWTAAQFTLPEEGDAIPLPFIPETLEHWVQWITDKVWQGDYADPKITAE